MDLSTILAANPEYISKVNDSVDKLQSKFETIKEYLNQPLSDDNFDKTFRLFLDVFDLVPLLKAKLTMPQIVRGRMHKQGEPLCSERWQISYNWRFKHKIKLGRFNQEGEPLFYGSLPTQSKEVDYVLSCALECCKELADEYNAPDVQDITVSGWKIEQPFDIVILCFDDLHLANNPDLKQAVDIYFDTIKTYFSHDAASFIEAFLRYFSELSRTIMDKNQSYQVLTPMFIAIRYYSETYNKEPIYGLIYPSAMTLAKGLNIVLTREAVKQFLRLDKVVMYRYCLVKPERKMWIADKCSDIVKVNGHKFKITGYVPPGRY